MGERVRGLAEGVYKQMAGHRAERRQKNWSEVNGATAQTNKVRSNSDIHSGWIWAKFQFWIKDRPQRRLRQSAERAARYCKWFIDKSNCLQLLLLCNLRKGLRDQCYCFILALLNCFFFSFWTTILCGIVLCILGSVNNYWLFNKCGAWGPFFFMYKTQGLFAI